MVAPHANLRAEAMHQHTLATFQRKWGIQKHVTMGEVQHEMQMGELLHMARYHTAWTVMHNQATAGACAIDVGKYSRIRLDDRQDIGRHMMGGGPLHTTNGTAHSIPAIPTDSSFSLPMAAQTKRSADAAVAADAQAWPIRFTSHADAKCSNPDSTGAMFDAKRHCTEHISAKALSSPSWPAAQAAVESFASAETSPPPRSLKANTRRAFQPTEEVRSPPPKRVIFQFPSVATNRIARAKLQASPPVRLTPKVTTAGDGALQPTVMSAFQFPLAAPAAQHPTSSPLSKEHRSKDIALAALLMLRSGNQAPAESSVPCAPAESSMPRVLAVADTPASSVAPAQCTHATTKSSFSRTDDVASFTRFFEESGARRLIAEAVAALRIESTVQPSLNAATFLCEWFARRAQLIEPGNHGSNSPEV